MATEAELRSQIERTLDIIDRSAKAVRDFFVFEVEQIGRTKFTAPYIAEKLENTYTALENLFEPISRYRGYVLDERHWHADLLTKMKLHDSDGRGPVLADDTFKLLNELRRFRHFKRHNYSTDYDWERLDELCDAFRTVIPLVKRDPAKVQLLLESIPPQDSAPGVPNGGQG